MPDGLLSVVLILSFGYLLLLVELFVPGGVVGILGLLVVGVGCWRAFDLGPLWGGAAMLLSLLVTGVALLAFNRSKTGRDLVLDNTASRQWKAPSGDLGELVGRRGVTLTALRPAGLADFDGRRLDVVSDSEFIDQGVTVRVSVVEGRRVMVEPLEEGEG